MVTVAALLFKLKRARLPNLSNYKAVNLRLIEVFGSISMLTLSLKTNYFYQNEFPKWRIQAGGCRSSDREAIRRVKANTDFP